MKERAGGLAAPRHAPLKAGGSFGEDVALGVCAEFRVTVRATAACEMYMIEKEELSDAFSQARKRDVYILYI